MKPVFIISTVIILASCSSLEKSTILGAIIGGAAGGYIGKSSSSEDRREQSLVIGSAIGAGVGSWIGHSAFNDKIKRNQESLLKQNPFESRTPSLTAPKVRRVWVPARIEGEKYIDGHYMYLLEKTSGWSE